MNGAKRKSCINDVTQVFNLKQKINDICFLLAYLLRADFAIAVHAFFVMLTRYLQGAQKYDCSLLFPVFDPNEALASIKNVLSQSDEKTKIVVFINGPKFRDKHIDMLKFYNSNMTVIRSSAAHGSIGALNVLLAFDYLCNRSKSFSIISDHDELSQNWYPVMFERLFSQNSLVGVWADTFIRNKNKKLVKAQTPKDKKYKSLIKLIHNSENKTNSINRKLVDTYISESELSNNFGYAIFGMFKRRSFSQTGLIPETFLGDRFFIIKLLSSGKEIQKVTNCFRIDTKTNKLSRPSTTLEKQQRLIKRSRKASITEFKDSCINLWDVDKEGKYLLANNKNIDIDLLNAIHNLFIIRKFKNWESSTASTSHKDARYTISIGNE